MILSSNESAIFFENYLPLLFYASVYEGILPEGSTIMDFEGTSIEVKVASRDAVFRNPGLIEDYKKDNHLFLETMLKDFTGNIKAGMLAEFILLKQGKSFAALSEMKTNTFYNVTCITQPFNEILEYIPCIIETAIFNFMGNLVCDGLIKGVNFRIGPNNKKEMLEEYQFQLKQNNVIELL